MEVGNKVKILYGEEKEKIGIIIEKQQGNVYKVIVNENIKFYSSVSLEKVGDNDERGMVQLSPIQETAVTS